MHQAEKSQNLSRVRIEIEIERERERERENISSAKKRLQQIEPMLESLEQIG